MQNPAIIRKPHRLPGDFCHRFQHNTGLLDTFAPPGSKVANGFRYQLLHTMHKITFFIFLLLTVCTPPVQAQSNLQYFLIFSARRPALKPFSLGGHAFVSWGRGQKDSTIYAVQTYGFYPNSKKSPLTVVTEVNTGDVTTGYRKNAVGKKVRQLIIQVDSMTWSRTRNQAEGWDGNGYNLLYKNCTDFIDYIAETAGLITPKTTNCLWLPVKPYNYIKRLWRKNRKHALRLNRLRFDPEGVTPNAILLGPDGEEEGK
jgi:hypothetical protein